MPGRLFAVAQVAQYFPALSVLGRMDLLVLYVLEVPMLFAVLLPMQCCVQSLCHVWSKPTAAGWSVVVNGALLAITVGFHYRFYVVQQFYGKWLWIAFLLFAVLLPLFSPLIIKPKRGKKNAR
jgi:hypothetical protein